MVGWEAVQATCDGPSMVCACVFLHARCGCAPVHPPGVVAVLLDEQVAPAEDVVDVLARQRRIVCSRTSVRQKAPNCYSRALNAGNERIGTRTWNLPRITPSTVLLSRTFVSPQRFTPSSNSLRYARQNVDWICEYARKAVMKSGNHEALRKLLGRLGSLICPGERIVTRVESAMRCR